MIRPYYTIVLFLILFVTCHEGNTTNIDIRDEKHVVIKYVAVLLFIFFLLYSIISNSLMATTVLFCRKQDSPYSQAFVLIALQLIISNFASFIPQIVVVLPEILQNQNSTNVNQTTWINNTFSTFNTFSIFAVLHFSLLLTLNRFVAFVLPKYNAFFESTRLYFLIAFVWLSVLGITFCDFFFCTRKFLAWSISWEGDCTKSKEIGDIWWRIRYFWALCIPGIMFVLYVAIFYNIRKHRCGADINRNQRIGQMNAGRRTNTIRSYKYEWLMLIQAMWNCGILELGILSFNFLPPLLVDIFGEEINIPAKIFVNCYVILACATLSTIYFIYSKEERNIVKHYLNNFLCFITAYLKNTITITNA
uniref:G-protein coupled receptors family 1 profile domain-containing protein n=1 Tax=Onchocerca volvulus TaxID=6282 RepID=A0A8R1Y5I8_ONCVO